MTDSAASIWSAIAASFSAIAAISILCIQRMNMLDAARPEIVLFGWERKKEPGSDQELESLCFKSIKNIGKGPALHVFINSSEIDENKPQAVLSTKRISILPAGEEHDIDGEILMIWKNVENKDGTKYLPIDIEVLSWCSKNYRHKTSYKLMVVQSVKSHIFVSADEVASGVMMLTRNTTCKPVWFLKLSSKLSNMPGIKKFIQKA